jgi:hypothetical protein
MTARTLAALAAAALATLAASPALSLDVPASGEEARPAADARLGRVSVALPGLWSRGPSFEGAAHAGLYLTPELTYRWGARALTATLALDWRAIDLGGFALRVRGQAGPTALFGPAQLALDGELGVMLDWGGREGLAFSLGPHARGAALVGPPNTARADLGAAAALGVEVPWTGRAWLRAEAGYRLGGQGAGALYGDVGVALTFR